MQSGFFLFQKIKKCPRTLYYHVNNVHFMKTITFNVHVENTIKYEIYTEKK